MSYLLYGFWASSLKSNDPKNEAFPNNPRTHIFIYKRLLFLLVLPFHSDHQTITTTHGGPHGLRTSFVVQEQPLAMPVDLTQRYLNLCSTSFIPQPHRLLRHVHSNRLSPDSFPLSLERERSWVRSRRANREHSLYWLSSVSRPVYESPAAEDHSQDSRKRCVLVVVHHCCVADFRFVRTYHGRKVDRVSNVPYDAYHPKLIALSVACNAMVILQEEAPERPLPHSLQRSQQAPTSNSPGQHGQNRTRISSHSP